MTANLGEGKVWIQNMGRKSLSQEQEVMQLQFTSSGKEKKELVESHDHISPEWT